MAANLQVAGCGERCSASPPWTDGTRRPWIGIQHRDGGTCRTRACGECRRSRDSSPQARERCAVMQPYHNLVAGGPPCAPKAPE